MILSELNIFEFINKGAVFLAVALSSSFAQAQQGPSNLNIAGALFQADGTPVSGASVNFKIEIYDKTGACLLYSEDHLGEDLSGTKGGFSLQIGQGSSINNAIDASNPGLMTSKVFENSGAITGGWAGCPSGATLAAGENRVIRVQYDSGGGYVTMHPDVPIASAAYSIVAETLQGKRPADFIQVHDDVSNKLTQANVENIFSSTNYPKLTDLLSGTSSAYIPSTPTSAVSFNNQLLTNVASPVAGTDATNKDYVDGSIGGKTADLSGVGPATGDGYTLIWDKTAGKWTTGVPSATDNTKLPLDGSVAMSGTLNFDALIGTGIDLNGNDLLGAGHITMSPLKTLTLGSFTSADETTLIGTLTAANAGASWYNTTSNTFKIWNGTTAISQTFNGATAGGDLTGTYPNPTIANDKIVSAMVDSAGVNRNLLVISDQVDPSKLKFATCNTNEVLRYEDLNGWVCRDPNTIVTFPVKTVNGTSGDASGNVTLTPAILGLGTASLEDVGTDPGDVPQLDGSGKIPAALLPTGTGTITEVAAGVGLSGGGTTGTVTLDLADTVVTPGAYGAAGKVATFTVDQQGRLTAASQTDISIGDANITGIDGSKVSGDIAGNAAGFTGNLAGDVTGPQGTTVVEKIQGRAVANTAPAPDEVLMWNDTNSQWEPTAVPSAPVSSVAGRTGAVTLDYGDISNASGKYLTYKPNDTACGNDELLRFDGAKWVCTSVASALNGDYALSGANTDITSLGATTSITSTAALTLASSSNGDIALQPNGTGLVTTSSALRVAPTSLPLTPSAGTIVMDSSTGNAMKYYDGTDWQTLGTGTGSGDFMRNGSVAMTGNFNAGGNSVLGNTTSGGNLTLESTSDASKGYVNIQPNGGNVGIGTTSPSQKLEVAGNVKMTGMGNGITFPDGTTQTTAASGSPTFPLLGSLGSNAAPTYSFNGDSDTGIYSAGAGSIDFTSNGYSFMKVSNDFGGSLKLGAATFSSARALLDVKTSGPAAVFEDNASTDDLGSAPVSILRSRYGTTPPGAGFGTFLQFSLEGFTDDDYAVAGKISNFWEASQTDNTSSRDSAMVFSTMLNNSLAERMRISSSGNVGIGTDNPSEKLDVSGKVKASEFCIDADCVSAWPSGGSSQWVDGTASSINYTAGNVGIGTTNATQLLTVGSSGLFKVTSAGALTSGAISSSSSITSNSGTAGYGYVQLSGNSTNGGGIVRFASGQSSYVYDTAISRTGSKQLTVDDNNGGDISLLIKGNVGIGTAAPDRLLHVNGAARFTPTTEPTSPAAGDLYFDSTTSNALKFYDGAAWQTVGTGSGSGDFMKDGSVAMTGNLKLGTNYISNDGGASEGLAFDTSGNANFTGKVGIGTASPTLNLEVSGSFGADTGSNYFVIDSSAIESLSAENRFYTNGANTLALSFGLDQNTEIQGYNDGGYPVVLQKNGGNVGIGTASPARPLHVNGAMRMTPLATAPTTPASGDVYIDSADANKLKWYDGSAWQSAGGAAATDKVSKTGDTMSGNLNVAKAALTDTSTAVEHSAGGSYSGSISAFNSAGDTMAPFHAAVYGGSSGLKAFALIGERRPNSSWGTTINAVSNGTYLPGIGFAGQTSSTSGSGMTLSANINAVVNGTVSSGVLPTDLVFHTSATNSSGLGERMRITSGGNVGIGTNNPGQKLDVAGKIKATEFCIDADCISSWPSGGASQWVDGTSSSINYTAGNVGIGTTNPADGKLQIENIAVWGIQSAVGSGGKGIRVVTTDYDNGNAGSALKFMLGATTGNTYSLIEAATSGNMSVGDLVLQSSSTAKVGIGTTAPARLLHVNGAMRMTPLATAPTSPAAGDLYVDSTASNALKYYDGSAWQSAGGGGGSSQWTTSGSDIYFASGKVGIGLTSTPVSALEIDGALTVYDHSDGTVNIGNANTPGGSSTITIGYYNSAGGAGSVSMGQANNAAGMSDVAIGNGNTANGSPAAAVGKDNSVTGIYSNAFGVANVVTGNAASAFGYNNNLGDDQTIAIGNNITNNLGGSMMIGPSDTAKVTILSNGNVGIGTTNPGARLEVSSGTSDVSGLKFTNFNSSSPTSTGQAVGVDISGNLVTITGGGGVSFPLLGPAGSASAPSYAFSGSDADNGMFRPAANSVGFSTAGVERMRINSSGNAYFVNRLGIGQTATSPVSDLEISPAGISATITLTSFSDAASASSISNYASQLQLKAKGASSLISFGAGPSSTEYMRITAGGNVGIGTTAPNSKLEVNGNVAIGSQATRATASSRGQLSLSSTYTQTANANVTIDWNNGNIQELATFACAAGKTITFNNMKDGGAYSLLLSGSASHTGTCLFSGTGLTFKTSGGATAPASGKDVLFTFAVIGGNVVYSMVDNLQ